MRAAAAASSSCFWLWLLLPLDLFKGVPPSPVTFRVTRGLLLSPALSPSGISYNALSVMVTNELDSVWHSILDLYRPLTVWALDLFIFYYFRSPGMGEAWLFPSSAVELAAMVMLLYGTAIYNGSVALPCAGCFGGSAKGKATPAHLASPALGKSPLLRRCAESTLAKSPAQAGGQKQRLGVDLPPFNYGAAPSVGNRRNSDV